MTHFINQQFGSVRLVSNGVQKFAIESTQNLRQPMVVLHAFKDEEYKRQIDHILLNQDHLNSWRDLREIEKLAISYRKPSMYKSRVADFVEELSKKHPSLQEEDNQSPKGILLWEKYKPNKSLAILLYYLKQVLKVHSPSINHNEIDDLAQEIIKTFNFSANENGNCRNYTISDFTEGLQSSVERLNKWKQIISKTDQVVYGQSYREYMKLVEFIDVLAAAGLHDRNAILELKPSSIKLSLTSEVLFGKSPGSLKLHHYLTSDLPYNSLVALNDEIFGFYSEINGQNPNKIKDQVHQLWSEFEENHLGIALQMSEPVGIPQQKEFILPQEVTRMKEYKLLFEMTSNSKYKEMWRNISRSIGLVSKLTVGDSEALVVLCHILRSALYYFPRQELESDKLGLVIENSVMFYLFVRRIGKVLEEMFKIHFPNNTTKEKATRAQCIYWSLIIFQKPRNFYSYSRERKAKWMEFRLGRLYYDYLLASRKLNNLYHHMSTVQGKRTTNSLSYSTSRNPFSQSTTIDAPGHVQNMGWGTPNLYLNTIHALNLGTSRYLGRETQSKNLEKIPHQSLKTSTFSHILSHKRKFSTNKSLSDPKYCTLLTKKPSNKHTQNDLQVNNKKSLETKECNLENICITIHSQASLDKQQGSQNPSHQNAADFQTSAGELNNDAIAVKMAHWVPDVSSYLSQNRVTKFSLGPDIPATSSGTRGTSFLPDLNQSISKEDSNHILPDLNLPYNPNSSNY
ncbi:uncharacterized protein MELLADRAFT_111847 [Melampsora larici-populina 98AG31]|uniref:Uncharacterized protein n=1 Tax=Melampsora larici-populina (strain 98AG31 / pathotype 3-4-7) TaxID=747676 RepID=F4S4J2_MELLP|nr:uncharacterized protein MELLADRAFT_111847 [Melampsora larici-populina 98AG31]EGG00420.1 hypothetical protein MELLADRAFT_111847 [Melampsora larici-populina 98AG31]